MTAAERAAEAERLFGRRKRLPPDGLPFRARNPFEEGAEEESPDFEMAVPAFDARPSGAAGEAGGRLSPPTFDGRDRYGREGNPFGEDPAGADEAAPLVPPVAPRQPTFRTGPYDYQETPAAPTYAPAPRRDFSKEGRESLIGTLIAGVLGSMVGGGGRGGLALAGGYLQGRGRFLDRVADTERQKWEDDNNTTFREFGAKRQGVLDHNAVVARRADGDDDFNRTEASRFNTENAGYRSALQGFRAATTARDARKLKEQQAEEERKRKDEENRRAERGKFLDGLADLDPDSQQSVLQLAEQSGDLARWGLDVPKGKDGRFSFSLRKAAPPAKPGPTVEEARAKRLEEDLRQQYRMMASPRITKRGLARVGARIAQIQEALGFGDGASLDGVLDTMTPEARESFRLRWEEFKERKRHHKAVEDKAKAGQGGAGGLAPSLVNGNRREREQWLDGQLANVKNDRARLLAQLNTGQIKMEQYQATSAHFDRLEKQLRDKAFPSAPPPMVAPVTFEKPTAGQLSGPPIRVKLSNGKTATIRATKKP